MITREGLITFLVLMAGLTAGYFASLAMNSFQKQVASELPQGSSELAIPDPSVAMLSSIYLNYKDHFEEAVNQGADAFLKAPEGALRPGARELDLLRLLDYYRQFFLHYYRWVDTGNISSSSHYKLALGQFKATLDFLVEKYADDPLFSASQVEDFRRAIRLAERNGSSIRWAKLVVVMLTFLLVMGIPRLIRESGYKKYAASLCFDSIFRPHFISDLNAWHSKRTMSIALLLLYLFGILVFFTFNSWKLPLAFGVLGLIPVLIITTLAGSSGKFPEKLISLMAPKVLIVILVLGPVALRGPVFFWFRLWTSEVFRIVFLALLFMLIFRKLQVTTILSRQWSHRNRTGSTALVCLALGLQLLTAGAFLSLAGPEKSVLAINRELLLIPGDFWEPGVLKIFWPMMAAAFLTACSLILFIVHRKRRSEISRKS